MAKSRKSVFDEDNSDDIDNDGSEIRIHQNQNNQVTDSEKPIEQPPAQPTQEDAGYNPLGGEVKKRDYASNFGNTNEPAIDRVPEPPINNAPPPPPPPTTEKVPPQARPQEQKLNPDMVNAPPKDQKMYSTMMVDAILGGYKQFWGIASNYVSVTDEQIIEWVMSDKISMDITVPINDSGEEATLRDVYNIYNTQAKQALIVTDEFILSVRESMIREFTKRGWGLSDMQNIIQAFIRDAGEKSIAVFQLKATMNTFTKGVMKQHDEYKKLREELTNKRERVIPNEPTVIKKSSVPTPPTFEESVKQTEPREKVVKDAKEYIQKFEIQKSENKPTVNENGGGAEYQEAEIINEAAKNHEPVEDVERGNDDEPEIREVPVYDGEPDIQKDSKRILDEG